MEIHHDEDISSVYDVGNSENDPSAYRLSPTIKLERSTSATITSQFRPVDSLYYGTNTLHTFSNELEAGDHDSMATSAHQLMPAWDFLGQDLGGSLNNPLYLGDFAPDMGEDDEQTVSAPLSER